MLENRNDQFGEIFCLTTFLVKLVPLFLREHVVEFAAPRMSHVGKGTGHRLDLRVSGDGIGDHEQGVFEHVFHRLNPDDGRRNRWMPVEISGNDVLRCQHPGWPAVFGKKEVVRRLDAVVIGMRVAYQDLCGKCSHGIFLCARQCGSRLVQLAPV